MHGVVPATICGTHVDPRLTRALVQPGDAWHEYSRVDRSEAITAPCLILSGTNELLSFRFAWRPVQTDLMYLAKDTGEVSGITDPKAIEFQYKTLVGIDGAISQAPCKTKNGNYFTLTLQLPLIKVTDRSRRGDIERFMRVYFSATVATLGCS
ncbi:hypothetical protein ACGFX8_14780 [Streptomyces sp. NPDC048362]|uniref:hypothetical protein n=1 Tax=Streptomyces sp. NPDC048362 TaxID=3365539 RepID=UPI003721A400